MLGESILGDDEATERTRKVVACIGRADVGYVSVKISALCANLDVLAEVDSLARIEHRLREVYRAAMATTPRTFVNLDMEEYRDLELSLRSFMAVLDEPEFEGLEAGIVLQAYIPDSHAALEQALPLGERAVRPHRGGHQDPHRQGREPGDGAGRGRALHDWPQAPYPTKADVDASLQAHARGCPATRGHGRRPDRRREPQPVRDRLGA